MGLPKLKLYTLEKYLELEEHSPEKHEFWAGHIYAMAGASPNHNQICFNLAGIFSNQLKDRNCRGYSSDQKIWIETVELSTYPDLTIICSEPKYHTKYKLLLNPQVIIEALSPSTEAYDRGEKWQCYKQVPSLVDYLLVTQDTAQVEHFTRTANKQTWKYLSSTNLADTLTLKSINCQLPLSEIYHNVTFPEVRSLRVLTQDGY